MPMLSGTRTGMYLFKTERVRPQILLPLPQPQIFASTRLSAIPDLARTPRTPAQQTRAAASFDLRLTCGECVLKREGRAQAVCLYACVCVCVRARVRARKCMSPQPQMHEPSTPAPNTLKLEPRKQWRAAPTWTRTAWVLTGR
eukprot:1402098-Rhodomonas_salina.1